MTPAPVPRLGVAVGENADKCSDAQDLLKQQSIKAVTSSRPSRSREQTKSFTPYDGGDSHTATVVW